MPTSGTTAFAMTANDIVKQAMIELGALSSGETPSADEYADGIQRLNGMLKSWQTYGCNLWRETAATVTVPADSASGALPVDLRNIQSARVVITADYERLMAEWSRDDYLSLPNKTASGSPVAFYLSRQKTQPIMYVWPVPSEETSIKIDYERVVETVTNGTENVDVPEMWNEAVIMCLAARMINMFGAAKLDQLRAADVRREAARLEQMIYDDDRPEAVFMGAG